MRLSETDMLTEESSGLKPSAAFKILRDGTVSDNIVAMPSFEGSGSWNFLERPMQTRVTPFGTNTCPDLTIRKKLTEGSKWPYSCGIARVGQNSEDGSSLRKSDVNIPYQLEFAANEPYETLFTNTREFDDDGKQVSWLDQMKRIPSGASLFTVRALTAPAGIPNSRWVDIGTIDLASELVTSKFGDERLFFAHMKVKEDRDFWPSGWSRADGKIDPKFDSANRNDIWGDFVPAEDKGGWPSDPEGAKTMYMQ
mmetsp:Transcript_20843/g.25549  ORF Transcript_20843/g.25549 Transcript_20843/m.25549 type:complete len:253 (-) Transcript_20843:28-786(-)